MPIVRQDNRNYYEIKFVTTFADTNVVGNIYFANYILWQGKCRELFLHEFCPDVVKEIENGLALVTLDLSCRFVEQLRALETVVIRMYVEELSNTRMLLSFHYYRVEGSSYGLVCESHQSVASMRYVDGEFVTVQFPASMFDAIGEYHLAA
jgi:enediyne biosynthesis thioesterase